MPELPEVEVVRRGLDDHVVGRRIVGVEVTGARTARRQPGGPAEIVARLGGRTVSGAHRRGKYLWLTLDSEHAAGADCLLVHLGMSGQMLVTDAGAPPVRHMHARARLGDGTELRFVDQRTFGGLALADLVDDGAGGRVPAPVVHIARDPLDPAFDDDAFVRRVRSTGVEIKRVLLDQTVASGIGNIYADEALWRSRLHWARSTRGLDTAAALELLGHVTDVMTEALEVGGTTFDGLYVNVNGESGYFERGLNAYGRRDRPCGRCGTPIVREAFMNRSSFSCPTCQKAPRGVRPS